MIIQRGLTLCFHHGSLWKQCLNDCNKYWVENVFEERTVCPILSNNLKNCLLLVVSRLFCSLQIGSGHCRLCLIRCGSFQVVSCSLQVVSCSMQVVVGRFRSFLAHCRSSLQVVLGRFRSFLILVSTIVIHFLCGIIPNLALKTVPAHKMQI